MFHKLSIISIALRSVSFWNTREKSYRIAALSANPGKLLPLLFVVEKFPTLF
jgi:hypothetical protein